MMRVGGSEQINDAGGHNRLQQCEAVMADFTLGSMPPETRFDMRTIVTLSGAAVSLALIVGIGVWGYKLILRDATGIPVVKAIEEPMRLAPENPGGEVASNIGLEVNGLIRDGVAAEPEDRVLLAQPDTQPVPEDLALPIGDRVTDELGLRALEEGEIAPLAEAGEVTAGDQAPAVMTDPAAMNIAQNIDPNAPLSAEEILQLANQIAQQVTPLTAEEVEAARSVVGPATGVIVSPRPPVRPLTLTGLEPTAATTAAVTVDDDAQALFASQPLAAGTALVQFGDFDSATLAEREWVRLNETFGAFMEGKTQIIQRTEQTGQEKWRLRAAGFADPAEAQRFCAAFVAEEAVCFAVVVR